MECDQGDVSERKLEKLLASLPLLQGARCVRGLAGGPVSDSWLLHLDGQQLVLRADKPLAKRLALDRAAELEVLGSVAAAGFGPAVFWADPDGGLLVTGYIAGTHWTEEDASCPANIQRLASRMREIHSAEIPAPTLDIEANAALYAALTDTQQSRQLLAELRKVLAMGRNDLTEYGFCHNDAGYQNIVDSGSVMLIDWEYAATGLTWFDIVSAVAQNGYSASEARCFAEAYCGVYDEVIEQRLRLFSRLYDLVSALWYLVICAASDNMANQAQLRRIIKRLGPATG